MKRDDTLWKGILENIFDDFLRFFFKDAEAVFDFDKGFPIQLLVLNLTMKLMF